MIRKLKPVLFAVALLGVSGCFSDDVTPPENTVAAEVNLVNFSFDPDTVFISVGEAVRWVVVQGTHTVTADPAKAQFAASVELPQGAAVFDSGFMSQGETFEHTFDVVGTYKYFCIPHEAGQMVGWVVVQ